jgi:Na+/alanine symporter
MKRVKVQLHIAAAANVSHPTKQGLVQSLFGVYRYVVSLLSNRGYITGKYMYKSKFWDRWSIRIYIMALKMFL